MQQGHFQYAASVCTCAHLSHGVPRSARLLKHFLRSQLGFLISNLISQSKQACAYARRPCNSIFVCMGSGKNKLNVPNAHSPCKGDNVLIQFQHVFGAFNQSHSTRLEYSWNGAYTLSLSINSAPIIPFLTVWNSQHSFRIYTAWNFVTVTFPQNISDVTSTERQQENIKWKVLVILTNLRKFFIRLSYYWSWILS